MAFPSRKKTKKKYFTVEQANATLPLLKMILRDVTALAAQLREKHHQIVSLQADGTNQPAVDKLMAEMENGQVRMEEFESELRQLHVELKDYFTGLVDFPSMMDDREVYLCWRLDEPEVTHWHELDSGFAGRQKLAEKVGS